jgi:hypothetical protein
MHQNAQSLPFGNSNEPDMKKQSLGDCEPTEDVLSQQESTQGHPRRQSMIATTILGDREAP